MWKTLRNLARRAVGRPRIPEPYEVIRDFEAREFGWFNEDKRELLTGFPIGGGDTVVDVGCGDGMSSAFASSLGAEVYAVDIDPEAIRAVETRIRQWHHNPRRPFRTVLSDANPLPLPDGVATRVLAQEVMEHVDDPRQFMSELVRVGRPGALYLLSVPDSASESLQKALAPEIYWRKPNHLRVFGRDDFDRLVDDAGLEIEKRAHYSFYWSMWWALFWSDRGDGIPFGAPATPVLEHWNKTWAALREAPGGARIKKALDAFMPKSQVIIARKAA
jgi:SAM-dependent methyltransferase